MFGVFSSQQISLLNRICHCYKHCSRQISVLYLLVHVRALITDGMEAD